MGVGKRLAKERDELCRVRAHELAAAELAEENRALRERLGLAARASPHKASGERLVGGLAEMEHRLLLAEEGWRRLQQRSSPSLASVLSERRPLDILL